MRDSTINHLIQLLKKDGLIFQNDFTAKDVTKESLEKLRKKIIKGYKTYKWTLAITLSLVFATFLYLNIILPDITKTAEDIIRYWIIWLPLISINLFVLKFAWHGKRNLLILELLETEVLNNSST